jgi:hypothetical protein
MELLSLAHSMINDQKVDYGILSSLAKIPFESHVTRMNRRSCG